MTQWRFLLPYSAAWLVMACVFAVLIQASSAPMPVGIALIAGINNAIPGALLGLGAWWLATRLAGRGWSTAAFVAIHLLLALVYTAVWTGVIVATLAASAPAGLADFRASGGIGWQLMGGGLFYIVVAGIAHGRFITVRNHELAAAAARSEALRIQAELQALRARLDPHFLFNTLHSIMALVRHDTAAGERALERLGDLLRRVLALNRERAEEVPLADELDFVRDYIALELLRLGDRLAVMEDIDPDTLDCLVPVLTLQPLVENAIRHAIAPRAGGGTLRLTARFEGDALCIEIEDDGPGLAAGGGGTRNAGGGTDSAGNGMRNAGDGTRNAGDARRSGRGGTPGGPGDGRRTGGGGTHGSGDGAPRRGTTPGPDRRTRQSTAGDDDEQGMGIRLVRQRIEARHGQAARLELLPGAAGGACARITLPARTTPVHVFAEGR